MELRDIMNEHDRLDLSALDPMRDPDRWARIVAATTVRAEAAVARRGEDLFATIASWRRPLLLAAAVAVLVLVPIEVALEAREPRAEQVQRLVALSAGLHESDAPPPSTAFLRALTTQETR